MLRHTFLHLPGIGKITEQKLWDRGVLDWDDLEVLSPRQLQLFKDEKYRTRSPLEISKDALAVEDAEFFSDRLPSSDQFRIAASFPHKTLFVDIETTGLSRYYDEITLVGWDLDGDFGVCIQGQSDDRMYEVFGNAAVIVTFNGSLFDLPFLRQEYPDLSIPGCHIDLRFAARQVGISGGQKEIEDELGLERPESLQSMSGETAPVLWHNYRWGDTASLRRLINYNQADIEGMKWILDEVIERRTQDVGGPVAEAHRPQFFRPKEESEIGNRHSNGTASDVVVPYTGKRGPMVRYNELELNDDLRVVGIDLTGSEDRPSGWCLLHGNRASTRQLNSDDELIEATLKAEPTLVSIDSPLSLPKGRNHVEDSDPARDEYGIMRECERTLKKRGINVYPCLIKSMQQLTARGIRLTNRLRSHGIPVIESYPGAAQDILRIPRKQSGLDHLTNGLKRFGLEGRFTEDPVSHDELDAITSGVVGLFFWAGYFERLGNEEEDYLIIPEVDETENEWEDRFTIGLSGPTCAGKTTAGHVLEEVGFEYGRYSQVVKAETKKRGFEPTRENMQCVGQEIHEEKGQRWLGRKLLSMLDSKRRVVVDGMRHPEDHAFLSERFGPRFYHLTIKARREVRLKRYMEERGTKKEFQESSNHPVERNIPNLQKLAHRSISNDRTLSNFKERVVSLAEEITHLEKACL